MQEKAEIAHCFRKRSTKQSAIQYNNIDKNSYITIEKILIHYGWNPKRKAPLKTALAQRTPLSSVQYRAVGCERDHLPGNHLSAGEQRTLDRVLDSAAAGDFHAHDRHALNLVEP